MPQGCISLGCRYLSVDLVLDTHIYTAHSTASDVLYAGVPLLTVVSPTFQVLYPVRVVQGIMICSHSTTFSISHPLASSACMCVHVTTMAGSRGFFCVECCWPEHSCGVLAQGMVQHVRICVGFLGLVLPTHSSYEHPLCNDMLQEYEAVALRLLGSPGLLRAFRQHLTAARCVAPCTPTLARPCWSYLVPHPAPLLL